MYREIFGTGKVIAKKLSDKSDKFQVLQICDLSFVLKASKNLRRVACYLKRTFIIFADLNR